MAVTGVAFAIWLAVFAVTIVEFPPDLPANDFAPISTVSNRAQPAVPIVEVLSSGPSHLATDPDQKPHHDHNDHYQPVPVANPCKPVFKAPGSALADDKDPRPLSVFALLPNTPVSAFQSFVNNCAQVDVLVPDWFEIGGEGFDLRPIALDPDFVAALGSVFDSGVAAPLLMPMMSLSYEMDRNAFLGQTKDILYRKRLVEQIGEALLASKAAGVCMSLDFPATADLSGVEALLSDIHDAFRLSGSQLCTILSAESEIWKRPGIIAASDYVIVKMFRSPWIGSAPGPLAPDDQFLASAAQIAEAVGRKKLVASVGVMAVDWVSGHPTPETLSFAEAMIRIAAAKGNVAYAASARNSYSQFVDKAGLRHQIWFLDAASLHNSLMDLHELGVAQIGLSDLGQEDPEVWSTLAGFDPQARNVTPDLQPVSLDGKVYFKGVGSFYQWADAPQTGLRTQVQDPKTGKIIDQNWAVLPQAAVMQRFGQGDGVQVALTFDDGPSADATLEILDALKAADAPATFFVVGSAVLKNPDVLRRIVADGHLVGTHTFTHPKLGEVDPWRLELELSATQRLVTGITGHTMRVFRPPYVRGDGPIEGAEAKAFSAVAKRGYIVAGSDIAPPDWSGMSADTIVDSVVSGLDLGKGNVIVLHDAKGDGMHTAEAVGKLVKVLRERGYQIVPLANILGTTTAALMPMTAAQMSGFNTLSFGAIIGATQLIHGVFWLVLALGLARSLLYLVMACLRAPTRVSSLRALPSVTIVIPAFNESDVILNSVQTALNSDYPDIRVIVVDDGSTDDTLAKVQAAFGNQSAVTILTQKNQGKWMALNTAYAAMTSEIAVCMDADTVIAPDAVFHLVQPFVDTRVGAVAGTILVGNTRNVLTKLQALEYFTTQNIGRRAHEYINGIIVVPGALGAWRVEAVRDIGMLSNETLTEDTDLTIWMLRGGYRIAYADRATGYTEAPSDIRSLLKQRLRWNTGILQALWKHKTAFLESRSLRLFSLADLAVFGYVLPILAPVVDVIFFSMLFGALADIVGGQWPDLTGASRAMMLGYILLPMVDLVMILVAFAFDRRASLWLLLVWPLQGFFYRQILYFSALRALGSAISGQLTGWDKLKRHGMGRQA
ncbi:glycosyltransferase [Pseudorhodobacter sp. W20_MBD10_FR17]|uniref:glycosyltransferase n=1 Tax=Pseudorhodobacter sp. W20_MBD10_FR17 TaxID=3240266 RepID=UPI003F9918F4